MTRLIKMLRTKRFDPFMGVRLGISRNRTVVANRPINHPKGAKEIMRIPLGDPIPPGVILGKGTVITVE